MSEDRKQPCMSEDIYLSVIIPGRNQGRVLARTLSDIESHIKRMDFETEVIYVDGHSDDATSQIIREFEGTIRNFRSFHDTDHGLGPGFTGKGAGVKTGMLKARGQLRMYLDADSSAPFTEIDRFLPFFEDGYQVVMGSRYIAGPRTVGNSAGLAFTKALREVTELLATGRTGSNISRKKQAWLRQLMSRGGNLAFVTFLGIDAADSRCGFKAYTREAAEKIFPYTRIPGFGFEEEVLLLARMNNLKTIEVPVAWYDNEEDSNIKPFRDSVKSFAEIFKVKWFQLSGKYKEPS